MGDAAYAIAGLAQLAGGYMGGVNQRQQQKFAQGIERRRQTLAETEAQNAKELADRQITEQIDYHRGLLSNEAYRNELGAMAEARADRLARGQLSHEAALLPSQIALQDVQAAYYRQQTEENKGLAGIRQRKAEQDLLTTILTNVGLDAEAYIKRLDANRAGATNEQRTILENSMYEAGIVGSKAARLRDEILSKSYEIDPLAEALAMFHGRHGEEEEKTGRGKTATLLVEPTISTARSEASKARTEAGYAPVLAKLDVQTRRAALVTQRHLNDVEDRRLALEEAQTNIQKGQVTINGVTLKATPAQAAQIRITLNQVDTWDDEIKKLNDDLRNPLVVQDPQQLALAQARIAALEAKVEGAYARVNKIMGATVPGTTTAPAPAPAAPGQVYVPRPGVFISPGPPKGF